MNDNETAGRSKRVISVRQYGRSLCRSWMRCRLAAAVFPRNGTFDEWLLNNEADCRDSLDRDSSMNMGSSSRAGGSASGAGAVCRGVREWQGRRKKSSAKHGAGVLPEV
jgi:hypothetical protein